MTLETEKQRVMYQVKHISRDTQDVFRGYFDMSSMEITERVNAIALFGDLPDDPNHVNIMIASHYEEEEDIDYSQLKLKGLWPNLAMPLLNE